MADTKISGLPASTTPLAGTEELPIVQSGVTRKVSVANLTAGRPITATQVTVSTGSVVIGTSGQGIDFSATPGTGTSELLNDYEEGTWTPTQGAGLTVVGAFTSFGVYTKIGRQVTVSGLLSGATSISAGASAVMTSGLPYNPANISSGTAVNNFLNGSSVLYASTGGDVFTQAAIASSTTITFTITYTV
jgi:hypothetical protein